MLSFLSTLSAITIIANLAICKSQAISSLNHESDNALQQEIFPHYQFECPLNPDVYTYEARFNFLGGLGVGFVHAELERIYFEYYFPKNHWVAFAAADQTIKGVKDKCTECYYNNNNYDDIDETQSIENDESNLYPQCIEECLDEVIFVATVNYDESNINDWTMMEFQIHSQISKKLNKKMYRIPPYNEILEVWGDELFPYRENAHFSADLYKLGETEYVHAKFWRKYDFAPTNDELSEYDSTNSWNPFTASPEGGDLEYDDSLCFISIASYYGGEYPYDDDALENQLPGFYIDTKHFANVHCFELKDIKVDCGQDWSWLDETFEAAEELEKEQENEKEEQNEGVYDVYDNDEEMENIESSSEIFTNIQSSDDKYSSSSADQPSLIKMKTTAVAKELNIDELEEKLDGLNANEKTTSIPEQKQEHKQKQSAIPTAKPTQKPTIQPPHDEDCCSAISQISYSDINCLNISLSDKYINELEGDWRLKECGKKENFPNDLSSAITNSEYNECQHLWAYFNQIYNICYKYAFTKNKMKIFKHFRSEGYECFDKNTNECQQKENELSLENHEDFNNFQYLDPSYIVPTKLNISNNGEKKESMNAEIEEMEQDGGLTVTSLVILGLIVAALAMYVIYWFCCSSESKGYIPHQHFIQNHGYYDEDTDEYENKFKNKYYRNKFDDVNNEYIDEKDLDDGSDWSEEEQLGVINDDYNNINIDDHEKKHQKSRHKHKSKKKKKNKSKKHHHHHRHKSDHKNNLNMNDAVEINVNNDEDEEDEEEENETLMDQALIVDEQNDDDDNQQEQDNVD